jgi:predicted phage terminase large subunit-like protein
MCLDYDPEVFFLGTPKGTLDKNGEESLYFELYKRGCNPDEPLWQSYQFSTHDNPLLKKETIDELESRTPPLIRLQEIEGEFINISEHRVFDEAWFSIVHDYEMPVDSAFIVKIMSLDTAFKKNDDSDFSACVCIYQTYDTYYVVDVVNDKYEFPELIKAVDGIYERHRPDAVLIEDRASGQSLIQTLRRETTYPVRAISPDKDKITRAHAVTPLCEARKVKLLEGAWNRKFLDQLSYFPDGSDDIVDAFSQAMTYLKTYRGGAKAGVTSYNTTAQTHQSINLRGYNDPYGQT